MLRKILILCVTMLVVCILIIKLFFGQKLCESFSVEKTCNIVGCEWKTVSCAETDGPIKKCVEKDANDTSILLCG